MNKRKNYIPGVILSLVACFCLGVVGVVDKIGTLQFNNPFIFSSQSILSALLFTIFFAFIYFKGLPVRILKQISFSSWGLIIIVGVFASGIFILFRFLGLTQSTGTFATLSQVITTALTAILARIFLKERLSKLFWGLFLVIIISMYFVSVGKLELANIKTGDLYILFGTLFLSLGNISSKIVVQKVNPVLLSVGRFFIGFIFLLITSLIYISHGSILSSFSIWVVLSGLLWSVCITTFSLAIKKVGVTFTTSILLLAPAITMIIEYFTINYQFTFVQIIAALVVVMCGIAIIVTNKTSKK